MKSMNELLRSTLGKIDKDYKSTLPNYIQYKKDMRALFKDKTMLSSYSEVLNKSDGETG